MPLSTQPSAPSPILWALGHPGNCASGIRTSISWDRSLWTKGRCWDHCPILQMMNRGELPTCPASSRALIWTKLAAWQGLHLDTWCLSDLGMSKTTVHPPPEQRHTQPHSDCSSESTAPTATPQSRGDRRDDLSRHVRPLHPISQ